MSQPTREQLREAVAALGRDACPRPYHRRNLTAAVEAYLALVEGPTDEQVEAAAKALVDRFASEGGGGVEWPEWSDLYDSEAAMWMERAEAALEAALRIEEPSMEAK
jgi:hypothetical protein